jgi:hypothetical protein
MTADERRRTEAPALFVLTGADMKSEHNQWLVLDRGNDGKLRVVLSDITDGVIASLDSCFEAAKLRATVTSVLRTREKQLEIIRQKAIEHAIIVPWVSDLGTADMEQLIEWGGKTIPLWHLVWSGALSVGEMVNPPEPAIAEFDYHHADGRIIKAGHQVGISPHQLGLAFDTARADLGKIIAVLSAAKNSGLSGIRGWLLEPTNNAVHVDCEKVTS